jgi:lipoate---protein ligase
MTGPVRRFAVDHRVGEAGVLHALEPRDVAGPHATWLDVERTALVLGSAQPLGHADLDACRREDVDVVRRRSGGGAVLIVPGEMVWLDIVLPVGDPLWVDDVGRSMWWLGDVWKTALESLGATAVEVHRGPVRHTAWSRQVCFDGLGAGEVTIGGHKAVGISQRRTRSWARMQSSVHLAWRPELMVQLLAQPRPAAAQLAAPALIVHPAASARVAVEAALQLR